MFRIPVAANCFASSQKQRKTNLLVADQQMIVYIVKHFQTSEDISYRRPLSRV